MKRFVEVFDPVIDTLCPGSHDFVIAMKHRSMFNVFDRMSLEEG